MSAALLVAMGHSMDVFLGGERSFGLMKNQSFGGMGLAVFCVISGYLVTQSRLRNTARDFAIARALRIFPALIAAVLVMALVMGPNVTTLTIRAYFASPQTWRFLLSGLVLPLNDSLPGVFGNGALIGQIYSLTPELLFYCFAGLLGAWRNFAYAVATALVGVWAYVILAGYEGLTFAANGNVQVHGTNVFVFPARLGTLCVFYILAGSTLATARLDQRILWRATPALVILWAAAMLQNDRLAYDMIEMAFLPLIVVAIGANERWVACLPAWLGDVSYGTYIYHFAAANILVSKIHSYSRAPGISASVALSAIMGWLSFQLVEKYALALKPGRHR